MKYKLNFDGTKTKNRTMQECIEREFLMEELGLDDMVLDAFNDAAKEVKENITKTKKEKEDD
jgi:DNA-binding protein YbaB